MRKKEGKQKIHSEQNGRNRDQNKEKERNVEKYEQRS